jgi:hypothetical protein
MVREIRSLPRGLIAPLTQAQLNSLRAFADGAMPTLPDEHRPRLLDLGLIALSEGRISVTALGRERLASDR